MANLSEDGSSIANFTACHGSGLAVSGGNFITSGNASGVYDGSYHNTPMDTADHKVGIVIGSKGTPNYFDGKVRHLGTGSSRDGWQGSVGGTNEAYLTEVNDGVGTDRVTATATFANGDTLWTEAVGSTIRMWINSGSNVASWSSSLYSTQVRVGMGLYHGGAPANNIGSFEASDVSSGGATAGGVTNSAAASLLGGSATAASAAAGVTLTAAATLNAGAASGSAAAAGQTLNLTGSLQPGAVTAASAAAGSTRSASAGLLSGSATAASQTSALTLTAATSLIAGSASGSAAGTAAGATLTVGAGLITGSPAASSAAAGQTRAVTASLIAGAASGGASGTAAGTTRIVAASLLAGGVAADAQAQAAILTATAGLIPGAASGPDVLPSWPGGGPVAIGDRRLGADRDRIGLATLRQRTRRIK